MNGELSRRRFLVLGGLGVAATTSWAMGRGAPAGAADLAEPPVLRSHRGRLEVTLVAAPGVRLAGRDTQALGYNGRSPGPTLRVRPGDELALRLTNNLSTPTNLHTHGLRVSPQGNADNPFVMVDPGASFDYRIQIPKDHPVGTFWYHPHHHGTTADQIFGGLAGALVVAAEPDLSVTRERVLVITDTTLTKDGHVADPGGMGRMMGRRGDLVLVNGEHRPTLAATTGTTQRWRIVNACASRILRLHLTGPGLHQIALDGIYLHRPQSAGVVLLSPGNRADFLVSPEAPGRFELRTEPRPPEEDNGSGPTNAPAPKPIRLATLAVTGSRRRAPSLPTALPAAPAITGPVHGNRKITFEMTMGGMGLGGLLPDGMGMGDGGMAWTIDGRSFDPKRDDQKVRAGDVEEWTIANDSPMDHPFHLHVWGFQVVADSSNNPVSGTAQDVVMVPANGWVRVRVAFTGFTGRTLYHCHVADHSDAGMMATVNVS
ncbi:MAG TPA: multicopper oxidase family protein [Sporichthyaceae bacterium]|jgi:FtsP/CotA-like multicopper oxidase with cupredoxin domain